MATAKLCYFLVSNLDIYLCIGFFIIAPLAINVRDRKTRPNQGIYDSAQNGLRIGLFVGLFVGFSTAAASRFYPEMPGGVVAGFLSGLASALTVGLIFGGMAFIQHFTLRFLLHRKRTLPWAMVDFLDDMTSIVILRKVGGGYIFVHRMLMEYFALLEAEDGVCSSTGGGDA